MNGTAPPRFTKGQRVTYRDGSRISIGTLEIGSGYVRDVNLLNSGAWVYEIVTSKGRRVGWLDSNHVRKYDDGNGNR